MDLSRYDLIPENLKQALDRYVSSGVETGGFLRAVLENNLSKAVGRADADNQQILPLLVSYVYNELPGDCWGGESEVEAWLLKHAAQRLACEEAEG